MSTLTRFNEAVNLTMTAGGGEAKLSPSLSEPGLRETHAWNMCIVRRHK